MKQFVSMIIQFVLVEQKYYFCAIIASSLEDGSDHNLSSNLT